jgi:uncharacterized protein (TIGR00251 family)
MSHPKSTPRSADEPAAAIDVRVIPRAGRSGIAGLRDGALLVRLAAAPVDGAANDELIALIARALHIPKRDITIVSGERSRSKRIRVADMNRAQVLACLAEAP